MDHSLPHPPRGASLLPVAAAWTLAVVVVSAVGGTATDTSSAWYQALDRPSWQPPGVVFGIVWTLLYALFAFSATLAWREVRGPRRRLTLGLYAANLVLNLAWTFLFFQLEAPEAAGVEILVLLGTIAALIALTLPHSRTAALALVPYAAWVVFATALTWTIAAWN